MFNFQTTWGLHPRLSHTVPPALKSATSKNASEGSAATSIPRSRFGFVFFAILCMYSVVVGAVQLGPCGKLLLKLRTGGIFFPPSPLSYQPVPRSSKSFRLETLAVGYNGGRSCISFSSTRIWHCMRFVRLSITLFVALLSTIAAAERVPWTTSRVTGSPDPPKEYHVQRVYPKLQFDQPVELMSLAETGKMMLLEVGGKLYTFDDDPECAKADLAIDLSPLIDGFQRAFGFAVHPRFSENRQVFVAYAGGPVARPDGTRLSRFVVSSESPYRIAAESEEVLLTWPSGGHNGCAIRFDSAGLLYFSAGDGARPYPPDEYDVGQDLSDLRSTICRIDVDKRDGERPYSIPQDNPFIDTRLASGKPARAEIWAYGLRNPWRFTIAPETDRIFCADVGWELWELVFDVRRGGNYGWSIFEGPQPIRSDITRGPTPISKPLVAYPHTVGQSITGGVVYRGDEHPQLRGTYLYGDFVSGLLWGLRPSENQVTWNPVLAETGLKIITFAESRDHEVLVLDHGGGIYKLAKNPAVGKSNHFPRQLSETGLFASTRSLEPASGVIAYTLAATAWQDGATSEFAIAVPGNETIQVNRNQRSWKYPSGTVFAKTLSLDVNSQKRRLETQILHFDGVNWQPYSYVWNDDQSDAELVAASGLKKELRSADSPHSASWSIHHRTQCRSCHSRQSGGAIGFTLANLDRPSPFDANQNQIDSLVAAGILSRRAPKDWNVATMADPGDRRASLEHRVRSYLAVNCAHCHCRGGGGTVPLDLTFSKPSDQINAIDFVATQGTFGIDDAMVIRPGDPYRSVLFYRMATSGTGHMPKLWSRDNDKVGLNLVHDWIRSLPSDAPPGNGKSVDATGTISDTTSSLRLFSRLMFDGRNEDAPASIVTTAGSSRNPLTAALFERFLPPEQRKKRLGQLINPKEILAIAGDGVRGREKFFATESGQCTACHRLLGSGRSVGPDLDGIAIKRTRKQLLDSILDPSQQVEPAFLGHMVLTDDGNVITGLKIEDSEDHLLIRQANGEDVRIANIEIESIKVQTQSLMPSGLAAEMTAQELADLLAFLCSLK